MQASWTEFLRDVHATPRLLWALLAGPALGAGAQVSEDRHLASSIGFFPMGLTLLCVIRQNCGPREHRAVVQDGCLERGALCAPHNWVWLMLSCGSGRPQNAWEAPEKHLSLPGLTPFPRVDL